MGNIKQRAWPEGRIDFLIENSAVHLQDAIYSAISHWNVCTPITLIENNNPPGDYLRIKCWWGDSSFASRIGQKRMGDRHTIRINRQTLTEYVRGVVMHEIGHIVGLYHEHQREDRDDYIIMFEHNMERVGKRTNMLWHLGTPLGDYDYDSIMHYSSKGYSRDGDDTIIPSAEKIVEANLENYPIRLGRRGGLSRGDIMAVYWLYDNPSYLRLMTETGFGGFTLYRDADFQDRSIFSLGDLRSLNTPGIDLNDSVDSIVLHGKICGVTLYRHADFRGPSVLVTDRKVNDLGDIRFDDGTPVRNEVSSVKAHYSGFTLYEHANFRGRKYFSPSDVDSLAPTRIGFNDMASSIELHGDTRSVELFRHANYQEPSIRVTERRVQNFQNLVFNDGSTVNDEVSSVKVHQS